LTSNLSWDGGQWHAALLKEKTAKRFALTVCDETRYKNEGVTYRACSRVFRLMIQTDCQTFPSFTVHVNTLPQI